MTAIQENLQRIRQELPPAVGLVAVSKFHPCEELMEAYEAGQRLFGENRPQELYEKVQRLPRDIEWHFIGHLQTNKLKLVVPYAALIHSVDSLRLLEAIRRHCEANDLRTRILIEVHIAEEETKSGFSREEAAELLRGDLTALCGDRITVCGLMGMATFTDDLEQVRREFRQLTSLFREIRDEHRSGLESFATLSFGMSNDYRIAVEEGSTLVRIGTDIFGPRKKA